MSEELETAKEVAKAVQETGKAVQGVTDLLGRVGTWMSGVMGTIPRDFVALVAGDRLNALRMRMQLEHLDSVRRKWEEILKRRDIESVEPIGPKLAVPAFEAIADESDETLQGLWARLLANAMDPNRDVQLQRILIDTLAQFEPIDAVIFERLNHLGVDQRTAGRMAETMAGAWRQSLIQVSLDRLDKLGCIDRSGGTFYRYTALGDELWHALGDND